MYALAATMTPDRCFELARGTYAEMLAAGITSRRRVRLPALLRRADRRGERGRHPAHAARRVLPRGRLRRAAERRPTALQRRRRGQVGRARRGDQGREGRRRDPLRPRRAAPTSSPRSSSSRAASPLHFHVSEQRAENEACLAAHGRTPVQLLAEHGALGPDSTAVHATHLHRTTTPGRDDDLHVPDDRARPRRRHRQRGPAARARQRQPRDHRPVRGGARGGAQPAAEDRAPRPLHGARPARGRDEPRAASAGTTPAGSRPASART